MRSSRLTLVLVLVLLAENAWLLWPHFRALVLQYQDEPAARGRILAGQLGCFNCHGPDGAGGVANPGSRWQTVPGFGEQTIMMYAESDAEVEQYILEGAPDSKRNDADYQEAMKAQALRMPAYRAFVSRGELADLVAYIRATSGMFTPPEGAVSRGAELAKANGCMFCHGEMGVGGRPNPGALKGYIPGFVGQDFADLVQNEEELLSWIRTGGIERLEQNSLARYFIDRQRVQMPAFETFLSAEEVGDVAAYVRWLSEEKWRHQPLPH